MLRMAQILQYKKNTNLDLIGLNYLSDIYNNLYWVNIFYFFILFLQKIISNYNLIQRILLQPNTPLKIKPSIIMFNLFWMYE